ncbi:hypothetical protein AVEN_270804-1 [Araneus ventricosus]|uniref:Uncharacterized protein n=1 Tax=Araneus ventricosus TaxID=182803 RepID=A0A4Y2WJG8_ARAVE|nr:hypothetical protein AVEN_270804-1 [Araneus ventricosus]
MQSKSASTVYAQVNLELIKKREGKAFGRVLPFDVRDCIIDPDATVGSGLVLFLGCPETFGDFNSTSSDGSEKKYFIRYFLNVTNVRTVEKVPRVGDDTLQNDLVRFRILSEHMYKLYKGKFEADMRIRS